MSLIRVAIVGAGPVGLMLARLLLNKPNIEFVAFESENSEDALGQGGTLDLHPSTGITALKEAGLYDESLRRARFDGEALVICDKYLTKYVEMSGSDESSSHGRPEIDRRSLREMLLNAIPANKIRWGSHLRTIDEDHNLVFGHGIETGFDLIMGAECDGARPASLYPIKCQIIPVLLESPSISPMFKRQHLSATSSRTADLFSHTAMASL